MIIHTALKIAVNIRNLYPRHRTFTTTGPPARPGKYSYDKVPASAHVLSSIALQYNRVTRMQPRRSQAERSALVWSATARRYVRRRSAARSPASARDSSAQLTPL
jgi:hypothetical protein